MRQKSFTPLESNLPKRPKIRKKRFLTGFTLIELLVVIAILGLIFTIILGNLREAREKAKLVKVAEDLDQIQLAMEIARNDQDKVLLQITGSGCSDCACRDDPDLRFPDDDCINSMTNAFQKIGLPLVKDPWGSLYLIDENELEFDGDPCRKDSFGSAGPDRKFGEGDDIRENLPFYSFQCL